MNYYQILGISINATQEEIKNAYREMAKKYHPDLNPGKDTNKEMKEINEAYEVLSDLEKRKEYDLTIMQKNTTSKINNEDAYKSYTKLQVESEEDLEPWLKDYLQARRRLTKLYQEYINVEKVNIYLRQAYMSSGSPELAKSKELLNEIMKEIVSLSNKDGTNPSKVLSFLLAELEPVYNECANCGKSFISVLPERSILRDLFIAEIASIIKVYTNPQNEYYHDFLKHILLEYLTVCQKIRDCQSMYLLNPFYNFLRQIYEEVIKNNKQVVKEIVEGSTRK